MEASGTNMRHVGLPLYRPLSSRRLGPAEGGGITAGQVGYLFVSSIHGYLVSEYSWSNQTVGRRGKLAGSNALKGVGKDLGGSLRRTKAANARSSTMAQAIRTSLSE